MRLMASDREYSGRLRRYVAFITEETKNDGAISVKSGLTFIELLNIDGTPPLFFWVFNLPWRNQSIN